MNQLIIWLIVWVSVWAAWNLFFRQLFRGRNKQYIISGVFFLASFVAVLLLFNTYLQPFLPGLILGFLITTFIGLLSSDIKTLLTKIKSGKYFLLFHPFNILFQQAMILTAVKILNVYFGKGYHDYFFGILFMLIHVPVIFIKRAKLRYYFVALSVLGGMLFSYLIRNYTYGLTLSYLVHYFLYILFIYYLRDQNKI